MSYQIQADVDEIDATIKAMQEFSDLLHAHRRGLGEKVSGFLSDLFHGNFQSMFDTAVTTFVPEYGHLSSRIDDIAQRLNRFAERLREADVYGAGASGQSTFVIDGMRYTYTPPEFSDTALRVNGDQLKKLINFLGQYGMDNNQAIIAFDHFKSGLDWILGKDRDKIVDDYINHRYSDSDRAAKEFIDSILPNPPEGGEESVGFRLAANAGPKFLEGADISGEGEYIITRNDDGTYNAAFILTGGVSAGEGMSAGLTLGDQKLMLGGNIDVGANIQGIVEFKFDPNDPGDMTKMLLLSGALDTNSHLPMSPISPMISQLSDNFQSATLAPGAELSGQLGGLPIPGMYTQGELHIDGSMPYTIQKAPDGTVEIMQGITGSVSGSGQINSPFLKDLNIQGQAGIAFETYNVHNLQKNTDAIKVIAQLQYDPKSSINFPDQLNKFVPKADLSNYIPQSQHLTSYTVEYTLNNPSEAVRQAIASGQGIDMSQMMQHQ